MERYNFKNVEKKWQEFWDKNKSFKSSLDKAKKKFLPAVKEPRESLADISKAKQILKWEPTTNVEEWIIDNLNV